MDLRGPCAPARQDEAPQRLETGAQPVRVLLETPDMAFEDAMDRGGLRSRARELALRDEHLVLQPEQQLGGVASRRELRGRAAEVGPELVVGADRADAERILPYAATTQEAGLAAVAGAGV